MSVQSPSFSKLTQAPLLDFSPLRRWLRGLACVAEAPAQADASQRLPHPKVSRAAEQPRLAVGLKCALQAVRDCESVARRTLPRVAHVLTSCLAKAPEADSKEQDALQMAMSYYLRARRTLPAVADALAVTGPQWSLQCTCTALRVVMFMDAGEQGRPEGVELLAELQKKLSGQLRGSPVHDAALTQDAAFAAAASSLAGADWGRLAAAAAGQAEASVAASMILTVWASGMPVIFQPACTVTETSGTTA
ncbi:hypothetical protein WJX81_003162 [Elliptochloris bilobata]|uniref:Uncharacterized protein n=1 Tax=Elliptochloris bilobata TaxID=381761 RepID=A0AAW1SIM3_9CHLO